MAALELSPAERPRLVVLGASNVSRGLARLVAAVERRTPAADLFVAAGHGRSYGANSRVWMRRLPSILGCGLWRAVDRAAGDGAHTGSGGPVHGLVTDVGNDLLYGFASEQVAGWVRESVRRLADRGGRIAITRLPLASIAGVGRVRYRALRTLFVPGCRLPLAELKAAAADLDARLVEIAREHAATVIEQPGGWYGLDAIHVRRRHLDTLWAQAYAAWDLGPQPGRPRRSLARWAAVGSRAAEVRSLAGVVRFKPQPVYRSRTGLRLWLY